MPAYRLVNNYLLFWKTLLPLTTDGSKNHLADDAEDEGSRLPATLINIYLYKLHHIQEGYSPPYLLSQRGILARPQISIGEILHSLFTILSL
jgi:hypothetical protein